MAIYMLVVSYAYYIHDALLFLLHFLLIVVLFCLFKCLPYRSTLIIDYILNKCVIAIMVCVL